MPGFNKYELELFSKKAADAFVRDGVDLDDTITSQAMENDFTDHHVDRVVQKANSYVNASLVKSARDAKSDPRVSFKLASAESVKSRVRGDDKKLRAEEKTAAAHRLAAFTVPAPVVDKTAAVRSAFGDMARDPMSDRPWSLDPDELVVAYVKEAHVASAVASRTDVETLNSAHQTLESMTAQARTEAMAAKIAAGEAEESLVDEIRGLMLSGNNPATLRSVVRLGAGDDKLASYVDTLITDIGVDLGVREGRSAFAPGSVVNGGHPLLAKIASVRPALEKLARVEKARDRLIKAAENARSDMAVAVRRSRR